MDSLTALRQAIMTGREAQIKYDKDRRVLGVDGTDFPVDTPCAFRMGKRDKTYPLLSVWLAWSNKERSATDIMKLSSMQKTPFVLVTDKATLVAYLQGAVEALEYVDASLLRGAGAGAAAGAATAAGGAAAGAALGDDATLTDAAVVERAVRAEIPLPGRTRSSVLQVPGKNFRDEVFKYFMDVKAAEAEAAAAAKEAASIAARRVDAGGSRKRGREEGGGGGAGARGSAAAAPAPPRQLTPSEIAAVWRGTPVIVVPSTATSLINLYNAAAFLQEGRFVPPAEARAAMGSQPKPSKVVIRRKDSRGHMCQYYVIDSVEMLKKDDWMKVAAVFAQGPEWQFKGWRWGRGDGRPDITPAEIFDPQRCLGFHLQYDGDATHESIGKWNVAVLPVSKSRRYLDPGVAQRFWSLMDQFVLVHKPYLLPRGVSNLGGGAAGGGAGAPR